MDNLFTLCLLGLFVMVGLMLLPRLLSGFGGSPGAGYDENLTGSERPEYDDPNISSRGGFGRGTRSGRPGNIGIFPRNRGGSQRPSVDNPNVRSRGGFGRDRD